MKKIFMMLGIASMMTFISSCTSDPCEGKTATELCSGKGTLADQNGTCGCNCNDGYTGTKCETELSASMTGSYSNIENGTKSGNISFTSAVSKGSTPDKIKMTPFAGPNPASGAFVNPIVINVKNNGTWTIDAIEPDGDKYWITSASGTWTKNNSGKHVFKGKYTVEDRTSANITYDVVTITSWTQL